MRIHELLEVPFRPKASLKLQRIAFTNQRDAGLQSLFTEPRHTMASPPWFYYPFTDIEQSSVELNGDEVNHIIGARRLHPGDLLILMNGRGSLAHCVLDEADKKARRVRLRVSLIAQVEHPDKQRVLASAVPKGDHLSSMLDMACQLGMTHFQPLQYERSVSHWNAKLQTRCERIVLEAAKQSKRAWVPKIEAIQPYSDFLISGKSKELQMLADQFGHPVQSYQNEIKSAEKLTLIVGPEGGLNAQEMKLAQQQTLALVRLAEPILRIETAAVAGMAALNQTGL